MFSGQGGQWAGMGRQLLKEESVFRESLERIDQLLFPLAGWSIMQELTGAEADSRMGQTEVAQPLQFALQVALAALWRWWGVLPDAVVGHSMGEVAAACVAGALRLEHKQASLEELGQLHDPVLTKDAIAGRIRRLLAMADKRAEELGIPDTEASLTPEMLAEE